MTEYEQVSLFFAILEVANTSLTIYMTLLFGMVVASYMAAHRLDRVMMVLALIIYSIFCLGLCNQIFHVFSDFSRLGLHIAAQGVGPNTDLGWFGPVINNPESLRHIPAFGLLMIFSAYVGSVLFFLRARKANRSKDVGPVSG